METLGFVAEKLGNETQRNGMKSRAQQGGAEEEHRDVSYEKERRCVNAQRS